MNTKSLVSALAAVAAIGLQAATTYTATEQYVQNVVKAESNRTDLAIGALRQEVWDAKYLTPSAIKAGANISVTTNAAGEVTIAADGGVEADFTTNNTVLVTTIETVAPSPGDYAAVSNAAVNALSRGEAEAGFTEWVCEPAIERGQPFSVVYRGRREQLDWWALYLGDRLIEDNFRSEINPTELLFDDTFPVTATRTRLPTMADATLTPQYSDWSVSHGDIPDGMTFSVEESFNEDISLWIYDVLAVYGGVRDLWGSYESDYRANEFSVNGLVSIDGASASGTLHAIRSIIGYTLGSQSDKPLQPKGDYATTADLDGINNLTIVTQDTSLIFSTNDIGGAVFGGMRDAGGGGEIVVDQEIIEGSRNAVAGGAVWSSLQNYLPASAANDFAQKSDLSVTNDYLRLSGGIMTGNIFNDMGSASFFNLNTSHADLGWGYSILSENGFYMSNTNGVDDVCISERGVEIDIGEDANKYTVVWPNKGGMFMVESDLADYMPIENPTAKGSITVTSKIPGSVGAFNISTLTEDGLNIVNNSAVNPYGTYYSNSSIRYSDSSTNQVYVLNSTNEYGIVRFGDLDGKQNKLVAGANITLVDNGDSTVTINSTGGGSSEADGTPEIVYKSNAIVNSTNTVVLTDNAYNNVTQGAESVLKIQIPASTGMRSRMFYLVYNCSNAGQTELFFDVNTLVTKILVADGDLTVFSPSVGTNIYKFEEIASDKFLLSRTVAVEL